MGTTKRVIQKRGKHLAQLYKRLGEWNKRPEILKLSKFDDINSLGLNCINPKSNRDKICLISNNRVIEVKAINSFTVVGYEHVLEENNQGELTCFYQQFPVLPKSATMNVYVSLGSSYHEQTWPKSEFENCIKMCKFLIENDNQTKFVLVPVLHTTAPLDASNE